LAEVEVEVTTEVDAVDPIESEPTTEPSDTPEVSNQEKETAEVENVTAVAPIEATVTWTRTTNESDLISQLVNAKRRYRTAEQEVEEIKEQLKEAKAHMEGCASRVMKIIDELENDAPENRPLFSNLEAKVEEAEGAAREEEPADTPAEPAWKSLTVDALPDITPKTKEQLRDGGINTLAELAEHIARSEHDSTAAWPKGIGKVKQTAICDALITVQDLERCQGSEGVPVTEVEAVYPTAEEWEAMSDSEQMDWLNARAIELQEAYPEPEQCECDAKAWSDGANAADNGEGIVNCELLPGAECDAWILGWLWQSKQEDVEADESDDTDAEE
jgi:hypothetical protein